MNLLSKEQRLTSLWNNLEYYRGMNAEYELSLQATDLLTQDEALEGQMYDPA